MLTLKQLRDRCLDLADTDLGEYVRPGLVNTPAIWVWDRPLPQDWKVNTSNLDEALISAVECVIDPNPNPDIRSRTFKHKFDWQAYTVRLIQHDRRQPLNTIKNRFIGGFQTLGQVSYLEGTDLYNAQYVIPILDPIAITVCPTSL
jgi:hypothetical protein